MKKIAMDTDILYEQRETKNKGTQGKRLAAAPAAAAAASPSCTHQYNSKNTYSLQEHMKSSR